MVDGPIETLESLRELYEDAPCGDLSALPDGTILRVNRTLAGWTGHGEPGFCVGGRFQTLLTSPGALLFETYCVPLLQLQGFINEVALDLVDREGKRLPVLLCATARRDAAGAVELLRIVVFNAPTRREYERELVRARTEAEEATQQVRVHRELAERKVAEQAALLHSVGRMAAGDLKTPITLDISGSLLPLASELERLRKDTLWQIEALKERNEEIQKLNRELRHQIEQRSAMLAQSLMSRPEHRSSEWLGLLPRGTVLAERYKVGELLGQGGMATVYQVERLSDGRRFAAKVLSVRPNYQGLTRFAREAQFLARLQHPNLIDIVDTDVTADRVAYMVMELALGKSLADHSARYGELGFILPVLSQVVAALVAVHAAGVVHRDLKPSNVLITSEQAGAEVTAKLVDFGISLLLDPALTPAEQSMAPAIEAAVDAHAQRIALSPTVHLTHQDLVAAAAPVAAAQPPGQRRQGHSDELTQVGALLGTPAYMAPELAAGSRLAQPASDLFSFGVLAYQVLTGKLPFNEPPILTAILHNGVLPFVPLERLCPALDGGLARVIEHCLDPDPERRPTALELSRVLVRTLSKSGPVDRGVESGRT